MAERSCLWIKYPIILPISFLATRKWVVILHPWSQRVPDSGFKNPYFSGRKVDHAINDYLMSFATRKEKKYIGHYLASTYHQPSTLFTGILRCQPACCQRTHPTMLFIFYLILNYKKIYKKIINIINWNNLFHKISKNFILLATWLLPKKEVATRDFEIGFANKLDRKHSLVARSYLVAR